MASSFAVVGPGRVGSALARRWSEASFTLLGFVGREPARAERAVQFAGAGRVLTLAETAPATFVLIATPDDAVARVARAAAPFARRCALWLHASGSLDLVPLAPLAEAGCRIGSLHPLSPFPDPSLGYEQLPGAPAVLAGEASALRLLRVLARKAGLEPIALGTADRTLYHAACALGTNGVTALHGMVEALFARLDPAAARRLASAAIGAGLAASRTAGACAALSGPVARADQARIAAHLAALQSAGGDALPGYRALMAHAARLAAARGDLDGAQLRAVLAVLAAPAGA
jgi:predicted short-subunit dehydrogenase-like oxidoreductase (DUF2520 family)